ncbi:MAG: ABC-F family ATP-binding cassette domain-containing protein, partial [Oscillospiraceae bacterium]|nr:ABC-F family ATP-binding cassette domain-containing protein [Oscillospiraceae bacterium]
LDEPTNHLDIASREWVEDALEEYEGTLIFVSHDRYFVSKFATRVWELDNGSVRDFACGYEKYRSIKAHEQMPAAPAVKEKKERREKPKGGEKNAQKQVRAIEREIEKQEALLRELDEKIEAAAMDYQELARLMEEKMAAEAQYEDLMSRWEELSLLLEEGG